ncbi:MAG: CBS domain-containing protein, partial [Planctomycetota bacterium]
MVDIEPVPRGSMIATDQSRQEERSWEEERPWEVVTELVDADDRTGLEAYLRDLPICEQALTLNRLDEDHHTAVLTILPSEEAAELLRHLNETQAAELVDALPAASAASIVQELPSDEQADLIGDLENEQAEAIMDAMPASEAAAIRELTAYSDDVAGGLLVREVLRFNESTRVADVLASLSDNADEFRDYDVQYAYLTDDDDRLVGVLPMRNLLFARRQDAVAEIMIRDPLSVPALASLDELLDFFDAHHFLGVPVVDGD